MAQLDSRDSIECAGQRELPFGRRRFVALDSLRGFAATAVAFGHFGPLIDTTSYLGVDFFLVLSGFVLAHSYYFRTNVSVVKFALLRWSRMYPLHLLTLLAIAAIGIFAEGSVRFEGFLLHLFFIQNMGLGPERLTLNIPAWTISVEFWINFGIVIVFAVFGFGRKLRTLAVIALIGSIAFFIVAYFTKHLSTNAYDHQGILNSGLVRCTASFCLGVLTYSVYTTLKSKPRSFVLDLLLVMAFVFTLSSEIIETRWDLLAPLLFATIVLRFSISESAIAAALVKVRYLGEISFSIYLVHYPLFVIAEANFDFDRRNVEIEPLFALCVATFLVSATVYKYFEMPTYRFLRAKILSQGG